MKDFEEGQQRQQECRIIESIGDQLLTAYRKLIRRKRSLHHTRKINQTKYKPTNPTKTKTTKITKHKTKQKYDQTKENQSPSPTP